MITQLISPFLSREAERGMVRRRVRLRLRRWWLGPNTRGGKRPFQLHLRQGIAAVFVGNVRVLARSDVHAGGRRDPVLGHVPGRRDTHLGAVGWRRRWILIRHYVCHVYWRFERIRGGGARSPGVQFRMKVWWWGDDCHETGCWATTSPPELTKETREGGRGAIR